MKVAPQTLWGAIRTIEQWFCSRRRPTFGLFVMRLIRSQKWSSWLCSSGCTDEEQLAVISMCLRGSPRRTSSRSPARTLDSQCPDLETFLLSAPDLFRCRGALLGVQDIWMLFSSPLQARETLNRISYGVELVLWSPRLSSLRGMLVFSYYKGKFDTSWSCRCPPTWCKWTNGLVVWRTVGYKHSNTFRFQGQCFPYTIFV